MHAHLLMFHSDIVTARRKVFTSIIHDFDPEYNLVGCTRSSIVRIAMTIIHAFMAESRCCHASKHAALCTASLKKCGNVPLNIRIMDAPASYTNVSTTMQTVKKKGCGAGQLCAHQTSQCHCHEWPQVSRVRPRPDYIPSCTVLI